MIVLFLLVHAILLFNAAFHDPWIGYDGEAHVQYIDALARFRLPAVDDTPEWYSPPLPYLLPALSRAAGLSLTSAAKVAQLTQVLWGAVLAFYLLKICERLRPDDVRLKMAALGLLGALPVYYRSFAFVRGEPFLCAAAVFAACEAIALFVDGDGGWRRAARLGFGLGLAVLGRQWAFFMLPAFALPAAARWLRDAGRRRVVAGQLAVASLVCALTGGWFYLHLAMTHGSATAFGRGGSRSFSLSNQPASFYLGLGLDALFTEPVRPSFANQLLPTFYADVWGDYWCYFLVYGVDARNGKYLSGFWVDRALESSPAPGWLRSNRAAMIGYLGRVNVVSLIPAAFLLGGALLGAASCVPALRRDGATGAAGVRAFLFLLVALTMAGYFWFLVMYPSPVKGRTIKPTYVLQIFPFLALLGADLVVSIRARSVAAYRWTAALLGLCALHDLPAMITRTIVW